jgi:hypothetical protein
LYPKKNEIKPWKQKGWVIPPEQNSSFVANMEMVLDVYKRPFDPRYPVVCMDESPKQLIAETRTPIPASPGHPIIYDYEYRRCGMCNIFIACEPLAGKRMVKITKKKNQEGLGLFFGRDCKSIQRSRENNAGDGQSKHTRPRIVL